MKVLLANIPWRRGCCSGVRAGSRWPHIKDFTEGAYMPFPFFLAYAAALLKKNDFNAKLIDALASGLGENEFLGEADKYGPDLILIETSTVSLTSDLILIDKIDKNIPIALCGPDVNIREEKFLRKNKRISYVLKGEYEYTLLDLTRHIDKGSGLKDVLGLNFRKGGDVSVNPARPLIGNLDELPWPLREGLPMEKYIDVPGEMPLPSAQMLASRGCPYGCIFCLWPQVMYGGRSYRVREPKEVIDEMEYLINVMKFHSIYFDDDTFGVNKEWVLKFVEELKGRNAKGLVSVPWSIMTRADTIDEETLTKMRSAGLYAVKYGIESASQELVTNSGKNLDLKKARRVIEFTKRLGIKVHLTFMFGLAGETRETVEHTMRFASELDPFSSQFSIATPFPGTQYFKDLESDGRIISKKWSDYDGNHKAVFRPDSLSPKELERAKETACARWRRHKRVGTSSNKKNVRLLKIVYLFIVAVAYTISRKIYKGYKKTVFSPGE